MGRSSHLGSQYHLAEQLRIEAEWATGVMAAARVTRSTAVSGSA